MDQAGELAVGADDGYAAALEVAACRIAAGDEVDAVVVQLRAAGLNQIACIKAVRDLTGVDIGTAKRTVHNGPAFADRREANEALHEDLIEGLRKLAGRDGDADAVAGAE